MAVRPKSDVAAAEDKRKTQVLQVVQRLRLHHERILRKRGKPLDNCVRDIEDLRAGR